MKNKDEIDILSNLVMYDLYMYDENKKKFYPIMLHHFSSLNDAIIRAEQMSKIYQSEIFIIRSVPEIVTRVSNRY